jgi:predicted Ser/Thr protein kinase
VRPLELGDPSTVGRYRLLGRVGTGGMGVVYLGLAADVGLVAIKTLHPSYADLDDQRRRFTAEARYAERVPAYTARLIEDATSEIRPYIVIEYIEGPPLSHVVEEDGPLPAARLHEVASGVAAALTAVHEAGLVHRDLKPANVLLAEGGPRIIDFGIAHEVDAISGNTQVGVIMGSPGWIAPERLLGGPAVAASDVFSWGCLVAFAATGRHPYGGSDGEELAHRILNGVPDLRGLTTRLHALVAAALARDPAMRPAAGEILRELVAGAAADAGEGSGDGAALDRDPRHDGPAGEGSGAAVHALPGGHGGDGESMREPAANRPEDTAGRAGGRRHVHAGTAAVWAAAAAAAAAAIAFTIAGGDGGARVPAEGGALPPTPGGGPPPTSVGGRPSVPGSSPPAPVGRVASPPGIPATTTPAPALRSPGDRTETAPDPGRSSRPSAVPSVPAVRSWPSQLTTPPVQELRTK